MCINLIVGVGVAVLHQEVVQREIDFVFADVVGEGVQDLSALLIPDIGFALHQRKRGLVTEFTGAATQVTIELVAQIAVH